MKRSAALPHWCRSSKSVGNIEAVKALESNHTEGGRENFRGLVQGVGESETEKERERERESRFIREEQTRGEDIGCSFRWQISLRAPSRRRRSRHANRGWSVAEKRSWEPRTRPPPLNYRKPVGAASGSWKLLVPVCTNRPRAHVTLLRVTDFRWQRRDEIAQACGIQPNAESRKHT